MLLFYSVILYIHFSIYSFKVLFYTVIYRIFLYSITRFLVCRRIYFCSFFLLFVYLLYMRKFLLRQHYDVIATFFGFLAHITVIVGRGTRTFSHRHKQIHIQEEITHVDSMFFFIKFFKQSLII